MTDQSHPTQEQIEAAVETVRQTIENHPSTPDGWAVNVVTWNLPGAGVRVAEVDWTKDRAGACYMQSDLPYGLAVCAQVERCIVALLFADSALDEDEYDQELLSLFHLLTEERAA